MDVIHTETLVRALAEEMGRKQILIATQDTEVRRQLEQAAPKEVLKTIQIRAWSEVGTIFE
jgi:hypothetical protein